MLGFVSVQLSLFQETQTNVFLTCFPLSTLMNKACHWNYQWIVDSNSDDIITAYI